MFAHGSAEPLEDPPRKYAKLAKSRSKKNDLALALPLAPSANPSWWDDSWHWTGLSLTFALSPFTLVALTYPSWTGTLGAWLAGGLYFGFGISALIVPAVTACLGLHLLLPRQRRPIQLSWAPILLWADLVWISQRMGGQGGFFGTLFDSLTLAAVGPMGSWTGAIAGLLASSLLVCRISPGQALRDASVELIHRLDRGLRWAASISLQLPQWSLPTWHWPSWSIPRWKRTEELPVRQPAAVAPAKPRKSAFPLMAEPTTPASAPLEAEESQEPLRRPLGPPSANDLGGATRLPLGPPSMEESEEEEPSLEAQELEISLRPAEIYVEGEAGQEVSRIINYRLPPISLLDELPSSYQRPQMEDKSQVLLDSLASFGVQASLLAIVQGPTVTRYELQPARGVKVSRFTSLTNDIALALAAKAVRIEAPIPGKSAIGIEIPNENTELVVLRDILGASKFRKSVGMSIALGKDLSGTPTFASLQKMPHLLVAGTTGSGKSVCINALIMSLLYRFTPRELQLLMIDPKQVELSIYEGIPHLISLAKGAGDSKNEGAIICDPKRAALALNQIVELMEHRYGLFAAQRVRNLDEYNQSSSDPLPWVVVLIDELADLMMVASKSVETAICRIAQKARAAGIHLVLATQRPSADVITGLIKVNVPSRIAFAVSSQVDSRVILDTGGAEQLLGKGDMLFCPVDASDPRRLQGCYVTNEEILRVVEWWRAQASPDNLIELQVSEAAEDQGEEEDGNDDDGPLVEQALQVVLRRQQASASLLQTELKVGYARARRLIYLMEKKGYIGPAEGSKPRKILAG